MSLTEATFASTLASSPSDMLIEFYAPWCGHCQALAPEYSELADTLHRDGVAVTVATYDADANPVPSGYEVTGFPTIVYVPKATGIPEVYDGPRTADAMAEFVKQQLKK